MTEASEGLQPISKWDILPQDHPLVIKRLVRELNHREAGFYFGGDRFNQARYSKGRLQVRQFYGPWIEAGRESNGVFEDGNGGTICASRTRCGH